MSDLFTFKYLDYPVIPKELILSVADALKQPRYPQILYTRELGESSSVSQHVINSELREWLTKNLDFEFHADYMVQKTRGVKHIDPGRNIAVNYVIESGGKMVPTTFYDPNHPETRISGKVFPTNQWHMINTAIPHWVEGTFTTRYLLTLTPVEHSLWSILPWAISTDPPQ